MTTMIEQKTRHLPATLPSQAERLGYKLLSSLDRMGFSKQNQDGSFFSVRFQDATVYAVDGYSVARYDVDVERLYHYKVTELIAPGVLKTLSCAARYEVRASTQKGLSYIVMLDKPPNVRLPKRVDLNLDAQPKGAYLVPIGLSPAGELWRPLQALGHVLLAGTTGAGKSCWVHSALVALQSQGVQFALVDPKRSELVPWSKSPALWADVATDPAAITSLLGAVVGEMDKRGDQLAKAGRRSVAELPSPPPPLVVVIDEVLSLERDTAELLKPIATRGRSAGVHLWTATQHASAISGLPRVVNVNLQTRLVFRVLDGSAARVAGCGGAQDLPATIPGRFLAKLGDRPELCQAFYVADLVGAIKAGDAGQGAQALSDLERDLVRYAMSELDGQFTIGRLADAHSEISKRQIDNLAQAWAELGLLTDVTGKGGRVLYRQVTPELAAIANGTA